MGYRKGEPIKFVKGHHLRLPEYQATLAKTRKPWTEDQRQRHRATKRAKALGSRHKTLRGNTWYWRIMTTDGLRYEHRVIAGEARGYPLERHEHVHHINGNGLDNRSENLRVVSHAEHMALHFKGKEPKAATSAHRVPEGRWSLAYECCLECGTTRQPHTARGLCATCYRRPYHERYRERRRIAR